MDHAARDYRLTRLAETRQPPMIVPMPSNALAGGEDGHHQYGLTANRTAAERRTLVLARRPKAWCVHLIVAVAAFLLTLGSATGASASPSRGLKFTPRSQLLGVPEAETPFAGAALPTSVDLRSDLPPAGDQGQQSSCVGWAVAYGVNPSVANRGRVGVTGHAARSISSERAISC
jgi:hypothetical protein